MWILVKANQVRSFFFDLFLFTLFPFPFPTFSFCSSFIFFSFPFIFRFRFFFLSLSLFFFFLLFLLLLFLVFFLYFFLSYLISLPRILIPLHFICTLCSIILSNPLLLQVCETLLDFSQFRFSDQQTSEHPNIEVVQHIEWTRAVSSSSSSV